MRIAALAAGLVLVSPFTATAYIDSNGAVSPETQMNGGGCYPASLTGPPTEQLNLLNPEWAAIDVGAHLPPQSDPVALHGTVVFAKINAGGDDPGDHDSDDQNTLIDVAAADMGLVATGNVGPPAGAPPAPTFGSRPTAAGPATAASSPIRPTRSSRPRSSASRSPSRSRTSTRATSPSTSRCRPALPATPARRASRCAIRRRSGSPGRR